MQEESIARPVKKDRPRRGRRRTNLARVVRAYREAERKSVRKFAAEIGVSYSALNRLELGRNGAGEATISRILRWLFDEASE